MIGLVDADIIVFRCGFAAERNQWHLHIPSQDYVGAFEYKKEAEKELNKRLPGQYSRVEGEDYKLFPERILEPFSHARQNVISLMNDIKEKLQLNDFDIKCFMSPSGKTFRHKLAKTRPYKGNRKVEHRPTYEKDLRDFIKSQWETHVGDNEEADDLLGIWQTKIGDDSVIISLDKDLDQIPGWKYKWTSDDLYEITEEQGMYNFHIQLMTGDSTDNIPGLPKIGPAKAAKALHGLETAHEQFDEVCRMYQIHSGKEDWQEYLIEQARLVWIRRYPNEMWENAFTGFSPEEMTEMELTLC